MSALEAVDQYTVPVGRDASAEDVLSGLYERHADRIFAFCRSRLRTREEAEDALQTTYLQALRALQRGVVPLSELAWLFKIAENVCLSAHRTNGRRGARELADGSDVVSELPAPEGRGEPLFGLEEALSGIPVNQRNAFVLRELRGCSYREIADSLELTVPAVETLIFRARRNLARALTAGAGLGGRVAGLFHAGSLVNAIKSVLGGASAVKALSGAAVVVVVTLPAGGSAPVRPAHEAPTSTTSVTRVEQRVARPDSVVSDPTRQTAPDRQADPGAPALGQGRLRSGSGDGGSTAPVDGPAAGAVEAPAPGAVESPAAASLEGTQPAEQERAGIHLPEPPPVPPVQQPAAPPVANDLPKLPEPPTVTVSSPEPPAVTVTVTLPEPPVRLPDPPVSLPNPNDVVTGLPKLP